MLTGTVVLHGPAGAATVEVGRVALRPGAPRPVGSGLTAGLVDQRLIRVVDALGRRRTVGDGWTTASELGRLVDTTLSTSGVRKYMERLVAPYSEDEYGRPCGPDGHHLIEYRDTKTFTGDGGGRRYGHSAGPWRLSVVPQLRPARIERVPPVAYLHAGARELEDARSRAKLVIDGGDLWGGRDHLAALAAAWFARSRVDRRARSFLLEMAMCLGQLSDVEMNLRLTHEAVAHAVHAQGLFKLARESRGWAHARQVEAHAWGQLDERLRAEAVARSALMVYDGRRSGRRDKLERSCYVGVIGQYASSGLRPARAERLLLSALRASEEHGGANWPIVWRCRLVQHYLRVNELHWAERAVDEALVLGGRALLPTTTRALLFRTELEFDLRAGDARGAQATAQDAYRHAKECGLLQPSSRLLPLVAAVEAKGYDVRDEERDRLEIG